MPELTAPSKGSKPAGAQTEAEASRKVREMFTQIAPRYDFLNHLLSLELDRLWRARAARRLRSILELPEAVALDLCCGTGDLMRAMGRSGGARLIGADFSHAMLVRAHAKNSMINSRTKAGSVPSVAFVEADALRLPFADNGFDLVTTAFGFRNLANYENGLKEIRRVLKPGGTLAILEFTEPAPGVVGDLYRWYCRAVLPRIGGFLSGNVSAYKYLPDSVARFFHPEELAVLIGRTGYESVHSELWTVGTVGFHTAKRAT